MLPDTTAIAAVLNGLNSLMGSAKQVLELNRNAAVQEAALKFNGILMDTTQRVIEVQADLGALTTRNAELEQANRQCAQRVRELVAEIERLTSFDEKRGPYELRKVGEGAIVYAPKEGTEESKTLHWLCPNCFEKKEKAILQGAAPTLGADVYRCPRCQFQLRVPNPDRAATILTSSTHRRDFFGDY